MAGGIFHFGKMEYSWNIPCKSGINEEYCWPKFHQYSANNPQFQGSNFTFQPLLPRNHGMWHSAVWYSSSPHHDPGSPPNGGSSPPYPGELCAKNRYSRYIPFLAKKRLLWLSLVLEACMANWGGPQGWRWCAPTYNITTPCDMYCTTESGFMKYSSFGSQGFLATFFYSSNIPQIFHFFVHFFSTYSDWALLSCVLRPCCAMGGYPPLVPSNCHLWWWSVTWFGFAWHKKVDKCAIKVE